MSLRRYLAFDFGAESGRLIAGTLSDGKLELDVLHRFPTEGITMLARRQWDVTRMYGEMLVALKAAVRKYGPKFDGIAVDTWGVDFGVLAADGTLLGNPTHYRDSQHQHCMDETLQRLGRERIYSRTGIQYMPINTLYQVLAMAQRKSPVMGCGKKMLLMGDLFGYLLSGVGACEYTNASTTQMLNPHTRSWDEELLKELGVPQQVLQPIVQPGTVLGPVLADVAKVTGLSPETLVIAPATHDTASAVVAVPATGESTDWAYLSSGTWSLLGAELESPIVNEQTLALNYTNEGGYGGTIRFLKNIIGLWIVQECRRCWQREQNVEIAYAQLMDEAASAPPFAAIIDVDDPRLVAPDNMCETVQTLVREGGYGDTLSRPQMMRCIMESLALRYRKTLHELDSLTGRTTRVLHIIGGGSQNTLLCQMTADACGIPVLAGPVEATAIGNIAVQAIATGAIDSLSAARQLIANSFELTRYAPAETQKWEEAARRLAESSSTTSTLGGN